MSVFQRAKVFLFENQTAKQTVAKNTVWLTISNFGGRLIKAVIVIYGARVLGTAEWGVFSYAVTLAAFFTLFIDPGINALLMREVSKADDEGERRILSTTFTVKLALIGLAALVVLFIAPHFSTLPGAKALLPLVILILSFDTLREFFSSFIRAQEKMEWEAGIFLLTNLSVVLAGFLFLSFSKTALFFGWGYVIGTGIGATTAAIVLRKYFRGIFSRFTPSIIKPIFASAWPFAITGALGLLLTNADILIISWMRSASEVGIYSAAIRLIQIFYIAPLVLQFSTLPLLARLANNDNERFRAALERTIKLVFIVSIPLALGGAILGTQVIEFIFGAAYAPGGLAFKLLMLSMVVDYPAVIISAAIFAYNRQKSLIAVSAIGAVVNVALDLILIPPFGIAGSAFGTLVTQILSNWYLWYAMKKINRFEVLSYLKKITLAGVLMSACTAVLFSLGTHVVPNVIISAAVYLIALYLVREPLVAEIKGVMMSAPPENGV